MGIISDSVANDLFATPEHNAGVQLWSVLSRGETHVEKRRRCLPNNRPDTFLDAQRGHTIRLRSCAHCVFEHFHSRTPDARIPGHVIAAGTISHRLGIPLFKDKSNIIVTVLPCSHSRHSMTNCYCWTRAYTF